MTEALTPPESTRDSAAVRTFAASSAWGRVAMATSGVVVAGVMAMPLSPIGRYFSLPSSQTDYGTHAKRAEELYEHGITFPHFLWHALVAAAHAMGPWLSWMEAARIVVVGSYGLQGAVLAWIVTTVVAEPHDRRQALGVVLLALLLVTVAPVTILTWGEPALYHGYLNMESYASPTQALLKPLGLVAFVLTVRAFDGRVSLVRGLSLVAAVVLSTFAKPSLLICLLPGALVLGGWRWVRGAVVHRGYLLLALVLPSLAILSWQYQSYLGPESRSAIIFAPLVVMGAYGSGLGPKFLMSILLPLTVLAAYRRKALAAPAIQLAWVQFAFAAGYTYLLAETRDTLAGNFAWTGQIATYLLCVSSTVFVLRHWTVGPRGIACALAFLLHAVSGVLFFVYPWDWGSVPSR